MGLIGRLSESIWSLQVAGPPLEESSMRSRSSRTSLVKSRLRCSVNIVHQPTLYMLSAEYQSGISDRLFQTAGSRQPPLSSSLSLPWLTHYFIFRFFISFKRELEIITLLVASDFTAHPAALSRFGFLDLQWTKICRFQIFQLKFEKSKTLARR